MVVISNNHSFSYLSAILFKASLISVSNTSSFVGSGAGAGASSFFLCKC